MKTKNKLLALLLCLSMTLAVVTPAAFAEGESGDEGTVISATNENQNAEPNGSEGAQTAGNLTSTAAQTETSVPTATGEVTLNSDYEVSTTWTISENTTLDLNGHTYKYTGTGYAIVVSKDAKLTIINSSDAVATIEKSNYGSMIQNRGTITIGAEGGSNDLLILKNSVSDLNNTATSLFKNEEDAVATINCGTFTKTKTDNPLTHDIHNYGQLTINNGVFSDRVMSYYYPEHEPALITIKGGTFKNQVGANTGYPCNDQIAKPGQVVIEGGEFTSWVLVAFGKSFADEDAKSETYITINGGDFTENSIAKDKGGRFVSAPNTNNVKIYGGTYAQDPTGWKDGNNEAISYLATKCVGYSNSKYTVKSAHSYTSKVTKEPTYTEEGVRTHTCTNCGASYTTSIDKLVYTPSDNSSSSDSGSDSGTKTETTKNPDGSTTITKTDSSGTVTETTKNNDGSTTTVETKKDGTVTETNTDKNGTSVTTVTDKNGNVQETKVSLSSNDTNTNGTVTLPIDDVTNTTSQNSAPEIDVVIPKGETVKVEIPVDNPTPGTVVIIVDQDGNETIIPTTQLTENGVSVTLDGSATIKIVDNSKTFDDVPEDNVFSDEIAAMSARNIMVGKDDETFDLYSEVTLNQIVNIAGRISGNVDVNDYTGGVNWGSEQGLPTGDQPATRGNVLSALYLAAGSPETVDYGKLSQFSDADQIPADLLPAVIWAVENGIIKGNPDGTLGLDSNVTRGQAAAFAGRALSFMA